MDNLLFFIAGLIPVGIIVVIVFLVILGNKKEKKYTQVQLESGEDKRIFMNFAKSLFERPEQYDYVAGSFIRNTREGDTYTTYYYSYVVAFHQNGELWICPYVCQNHVPMLRNKMQVDLSEAKISYDISKDQTTVNVYVAGEPLGFWVEDVVKSDGTDDTQAPFALDQSAERERLNQVLPKLKELCEKQKG
ncbi:MAG: hypothetical protein IJA10_14125 [Lachnospiraceae bacterium]|nr:hypothetical protein [Lachnospiraceae bacterium]